MLITIGLVIAIAFAAVDEIRARGQALTSWACIIGFGVLLVTRLS